MIHLKHEGEMLAFIFKSSPIVRKIVLILYLNHDDC